MSADNTTVLYRPVGPEELRLIASNGYRAFPPRLPEQPIFYPVLNEAYATQIARDWNVKASGAGYVTRFQLQTEFLKRYPIQIVGDATHRRQDRSDRSVHERSAEPKCLNMKADRAQTLHAIACACG
jgi:hypothetical protein